METKKSIRADLEKKKGLFLQLGLIISLGAALLAFEWRTPYNPKIIVSGDIWNNVPDETIISTRQPDKKEPVPVKPVITAINIVDNTVDVIDDPIIDAGAEPGDIIDSYVPVQLITKPDEEKGIDDPNEVFMVVEEMPSFKGGESAFRKYLQDNLVIPRAALEAGVKGKVYLSFVVDADGSLTRIKVLRGIGFGCDEECVRVLENCPSWNPGRQRTKAVKVEMSMPVEFNIQ